MLKCPHGVVTPMKSVKVNAKYQIAIPRFVREKLKVKAGDRLVVDVQDGMMVLIPGPTSYADDLLGLHGDIWKGMDSRDYLKAERDTWINMADE